MIAIRPATTDADLEAWIRVRRAVLPDESAGTVEGLRSRRAKSGSCCWPSSTASSPGSGLADRS